MSTAIEEGCPCPSESTNMKVNTSTKDVEHNVPTSNDFSSVADKSEGSGEYYSHAEGSMLLPPTTPEDLKMDKVILEETGEMTQECSKVLQKRRNPLAPSDFPKRQTRNEGLAEDLSKILLKHKVDK
jgi:hypothetical protein